MTEPLAAAEGYRAADAALEDYDGHSAIFKLPYESLDSYRTDFAKGWATDSLQARDAAGRKLPMCWNHDSNTVIGSAKSWSDQGDHLRLHNVFADFRAVPKAQEVHSLIRDGHLTGVSWHFRNGRTIQHPQTRSARRYVKADLMESSPVTYPSVPGASVAGIRSSGHGAVMGYQAYPQSMWDDYLRRQDVQRALEILERRRWEQSGVMAGLRAHKEGRDSGMDLEEDVDRALAKLDRRLPGRGRRY